MQDFAYLFGDSAASWLEGRGDARFRRYERYHRAARAAVDTNDDFDLEASNTIYESQCRESNSVVVQVLDSKAFKTIIIFFAILWGGSLLLPTLGRVAPVATGVTMCGLFISLRMKRFRK
jgi:hypothetical protein